MWCLTIVALTIVALSATGCSSICNSRLMPQNWFKSDAAAQAAAKPPMKVLVTSKHPSPANSVAAARVDPYSTSPPASAAGAPPASAGSDGAASFKPPPDLTHSSTIPNAKDVGL